MVLGITEEVRVNAVVLSFPQKRESIKHIIISSFEGSIVVKPCGAGLHLWHFGSTALLDYGAIVEKKRLWKI